MTPEEIAHDSAEVDQALNDPTHPWHNGVMVAIGAWDAETMTDKGRAFMRATMPYFFDADGNPKRPKSCPPA